MSFFKKNILSKIILSILIVSFVFPLGLAKEVFAATQTLTGSDGATYTYYENQQIVTDSNGVDYDVTSVDSNGNPSFIGSDGETVSLLSDTGNSTTPPTNTPPSGNPPTNTPPSGGGTVGYYPPAPAQQTSQARTAAANSSDPGKNSYSCWTGTLSSWNPADVIVRAFNALPCTVFFALSALIIRLSAFVMYVCAVTLNWVIDYTVLNMKVNVFGGSGADITKGLGVDVAWKTFRDVANLFFIFILLYIAIGTILQLESVNTKKLLSSLIVVALLINFSLFITEAIIDVSNVFAIAFLNEISVGSVPLSQAAEKHDYINNGLANAFLRPLGMGSFFGLPNETTVGASNLPQFANNDYIVVFIVYLTASIMLIIFGGLFLVGAVLFITRFVVLIFVMMLSPLAFMGMILPKTKGLISDKWWNTLFNQALFAPVYLMLTWAVIRILGSTPLTVLFPANETSNAFWQLFTFGAANGTQATGLAIFHFFIIVAFMIATYIISKSLASTGGSAVQSAVKWGTGKVGGMYGRGMVRGTARGASFGYNTAASFLPAGWESAVGGKGRFHSSSISDMNDAFKKSDFGQSIAGRAIRGVTTDAAVNAKFGGKESVADVDKKRKGEYKDYAKAREEDIQKEFEKNLHQNRQDRMNGGILNDRGDSVNLVASGQRTPQQHQEAMDALDAEEQEVRNNIEFQRQTGIVPAATKTEKARDLRRAQLAEIDRLGGKASTRTKWQAVKETVRQYTNYTSGRHAAIKLLKEKVSGKPSDLEATLAQLAAQQAGGTPAAGGAQAGGGHGTP